MYQINPCVADIQLNQQNVCNLCNKEVLDLSSYSDEEVNKLVQTTPGGICGSASISRMNTAYYLHPFRRFALAILVVFGSSVFVLDARAQDTIQKMQKDILEEKVSSEENFTIIEGIVIDKKSNEPLPFTNVWVEINNNKIGSVTDFDGKFIITITNSLVESNKPFTVNVSYITYNKVEIKSVFLEPGQKLNLGKIEMIENEEILLLGMPIPYYRQNILDPDNHRSTTIKSDEIKRMPRND